MSEWKFKVGHRQGVHRTGNLMENGWQFQPLQTPAWLIGFAVAVWLATAVISYRNWSRRGGKGVAAWSRCGSLSWA